MLGSTGHHSNLVLLKHPWVKFVWLEFVVVIPVSEDIVFSKTPGIDFVLASDYCEAVLTGSLDLGYRPSKSGFIVALFELPFPEIIDELWSIKVVDVF
jgi:hypothetical protein